MSHFEFGENIPLISLTYHSIIAYEVSIQFINLHFILFMRTFFHFYTTKKQSPRR